MSRKKPKFDVEEPVLTRPKKKYEPVNPSNSPFTTGDVVVLPSGETGTIDYVCGEIAFIITALGHVRQVRVFELAPYQKE